MIQHFDTTIAERFGINVAIIYFGIVGFQQSNKRAGIKHQDAMKKGSVKIRLDDTRNWNYMSTCEIREAITKMERNGLIDVQPTDDANVIYVYPVDHREVTNRQIALHFHEMEKKQRMAEDDGNRW